ncbi:MAG: hypothetical protein IJX67_03930 [Oscillospiraceae bacterium]|nr:hypothetical protein [Oscillospiraceae bacterium]
MNILYCGDRNIGDGLMLSLLSLLKHTEEPLHIYVLTMGYQDGSTAVEPLPQPLIDQIALRLKSKNPENTISLLDVSDLFALEPPTANLATRFTPCCMLRLYADMLPQLPEKLLYLDNDVICRKDFRDFYHQDMGEYELAGVLDHYGKWFFRRSPFYMDYLNSGVLLLNMKQIRQTQLFRQCRRRCAEKEMFMPDQSAINKLAVRKKLLPRRFNEQRKLHDNTVFQHFTTSFRFFPWFHAVSVKPWQIDRMHQVLKLHEYDDLLAEYTVWKQQIFAVTGN